MNPIQKTSLALGAAALICLAALVPSAEAELLDTGKFCAKAINEQSPQFTSASGYCPAEKAADWGTYLMIINYQIGESTGRTFTARFELKGIENAHFTGSTNLRINDRSIPAENTGSSLIWEFDVDASSSGVSGSIDLFVEGSQADLEKLELLVSSNSGYSDSAVGAIEFIG